MQQFPATITIGASPVQVTATYTPCCKIFFQIKSGSGKVYLGKDSTLASDGSSPSTIATLNPNSDPTQAGGSFSDEDQGGDNTIDASAWWVHGSNAGDKVTVLYQQR